ncbi:MAG TPA: FeoA family protein [Candidatus Limnocylindrales bacterium]|nr:FeoA family protein [Candidatus Limnocylindrales bacterium]
MRISESATQVWTLASIPVGMRVEVVEVGAERPQTLLVHGLRPGVRVVVEVDAPFGGPRVVRLGRARVAIDRRLAGAVRVAPAEAP